MASPYFFDADVARHAVEFFPRFLRLPSAEWYGRPFELNTHQAHHIRQIFGWRRRSDGTRRYRRVRWWEPKRNGKSVLFAGVGHMLTIGDNEPRAEVYSIARNEAQAAIVYDHARVMVALDIARDGTLGQLANEYQGSGKNSLFCPFTLSSFQPLAGDPEGKHGFSPHGILGDEVWEWRDGKLHRHLQKSTGSRRQPLDATFSAAGVVKTYGHELFEDSRAILADPSLDPETYVVICGPDPDEADTVDWTNENNWAKWNPNFPHSPKRDFLRGECRKAVRNPRLENEFKQFHCGIWTEQATRWFAMRNWRNNTRDPNDAMLWRKLFDELAGRPCRAALDLAARNDIAVASYLFEPEVAGGRWTFLRRAFCNQATVDERDAPRSPYRRWVEQGALIATPGNITDYDAIEAQLREDAQRFRIKQSDPDDPKQWDIAIDRFDGTQVTTHLQDDGFKVAQYGQEYSNMNAPARMIEDLFDTGKIEHGNHPVARWHYGNAAYRKDHRGYIKPDKERAADKIDIVVSDIMALGITMRVPRQIGSVYEERGLIEIDIGELAE